MDALTFSIELAKILVWPVFILIAIYILRDNISELLKNIKRVKHKDLVIEFEKEIARAREAIKTLPGPNSATENDMEIGELALLSPRGAIIEGWLEVEHALKAFNTRHGIHFKEEKELGISRNIMQILDHDVLDEQTVMVLAKLRKIRNDAVHLDDSSISPDTASEYKNMVKRVVNKINIA